MPHRSAVTLRCMYRIYHRMFVEQQCEEYYISQGYMDGRRWNQGAVGVYASGWTGNVSVRIWNRKIQAN